MQAWDDYQAIFEDAFDEWADEEDAILLETTLCVLYRIVMAVMHWLACTMPGYACFCKCFMTVCSVIKFRLNTQTFQCNTHTDFTSGTCNHKNHELTATVGVRLTITCMLTLALALDPRKSCQLCSNKRSNANRSKLADWYKGIYKGRYQCIRRWTGNCWNWDACRMVRNLLSA